MNTIFPYSVVLSVRGYEIDPWGHVNNSVYLNWLEHARWEMSRTHNMGMLFDNILPVVRHVELDFRAETLLGDRLRVTLWPRSTGNTSFVLGGAVRIVDADVADRRGKLALVSSMALVCVERGHGKTAVPQVWQQYFPAADPGFEPPAGV